MKMKKQLMQQLGKARIWLALKDRSKKMKLSFEKEKSKQQKSISFVVQIKDIYHNNAASHRQDYRGRYIGVGGESLNIYQTHWY